jgi:cystathionine beta-lyase/cystathionine gamma-synthase
MSASAPTPDRYRPETRLVHSGTLRSQFGETSEALFLTQGYVYDTAEQAERASTTRSRAPIFAFCQPHGGDVRGAHGGVRRR